MFRMTMTSLFAGALALGLTASAGAVETASPQSALKAEVAQLRTEMAQIRKQQGEDWMTQRRAEEIKGLIHEVLSDADTRASLLEDGVLAGHDGKHFFLKSADGAFKLNITGQFQLRYIVGVQGNNSSSEGEVTSSSHGFQLRRMKIGFQGHAFTKKFKYKFVLETNRNGGNSSFADDVWVQYEFADDAYVRLGNQKIPFLREELLSSSRQLAVDRASVTEFFTQNRALGANVIYKGFDMVHLQGGIFGGANSGVTDFNTTTQADTNLTARADVKLFGDWKAAKDYNAWEGTETSLFVGGAVSYQSGGASGSANGSEYFGWTADALFKTGPLSINLAYMGATLDDVAATRTPQGVLAQGGFFVIPDKLQPYLRYEFLDDDVAGNDTIHMVTVGANYFFEKHNLKLTADVVYVIAGNSATSISTFGSSPFSDGLGFDGFSGENQLVFRSQLQFLF